jgi:hypothetical protein
MPYDRMVNDEMMEQEVMHSKFEEEFEKQKQILKLKKKDCK